MTGWPVMTMLCGKVVAEKGKDFERAGRRAVARRVTPNIST
jgi:hypothetical protein